MRTDQRGLVALFIGMAMILGGCASGSGNVPPLTGVPLDKETARMQLKAVGAVRDSLLVSDFVFVPGDNQDERIRGHTSCGRTSCLTNVLGIPYARSLLLSNEEAEERGLYSDEAILSALEHYRGVSLGAFARTSRQRTVNVEVDTDILSYQGWMEYSQFTAELSTITHGLIHYGGQDHVFTGERYGLASSSGMETGSNPIDGSATWTGVMIGGRITDTSDVGIGVRGDATLTYDFPKQDIDVAFTRIHNSQPGIDGERFYPNMTWRNMPVRNGRFGENFDDPTLEGRFYGPDHEEVGGVFERNQIIGSFGARRQ